jgi:hypothetical protein
VGHVTYGLTTGPFCSRILLNSLPASYNEKKAVYTNNLIHTPTVK